MDGWAARHDAWARASGRPEPPVGHFGRPEPGMGQGVGDVGEVLLRSVLGQRAGADPLSALLAAQSSHMSRVLYDALVADQPRQLLYEQRFAAFRALLRLPPPLHAPDVLSLNDFHHYLLSLRHFRRLHPALQSRIAQPRRRSDFLHELREALQALGAQNIALRLQLDAARRSQRQVQALLTQKVSQTTAPSATCRCPNGARLGQVCQELKGLRATLRAVKERLAEQGRAPPDVAARSLTSALLESVEEDSGWISDEDLDWEPPKASASLCLPSATAPAPPRAPSRPVDGAKRTLCQRNAGAPAGREAGKRRKSGSLAKFCLVRTSRPSSAQPMAQSLNLPPAPPRAASAASEVGKLESLSAKLSRAEAVLESLLSQAHLMSLSAPQHSLQAQLQDPGTHVSPFAPQR